MCYGGGETHDVVHGGGREGDGDGEGLRAVRADVGAHQRGLRLRTQLLHHRHPVRLKPPGAHHRCACAVQPRDQNACESSSW